MRTSVQPPLENAEGLIPITPEGLINPAAAAVVALIIALWLDRYLKDWRWRPLLLLAISIALQALWHVLAGLPATRPTLFAVVWYGFLGASVAVFGQETIYNLFGLLGSGPRSNAQLALKLRSPWK